MALLYRSVVRFFFLRNLIGLLTRVPMPEEAENSPAFLQRWRRVPHFYRHVIINLMVGLSIAVLIHVFHDTPYLRDTQDKAMDWMISLTTETDSASENAVPIVLLDIDNNSYRKWHEPFLTPRRKVRDLIKFSVESGARQVIVDIDLSRETGDGDGDLQGYLESIAAQDDPENPPPHIILVKTFRVPEAGKTLDYREQRQSYLDDVVASSSFLHWASPLFNLDRDRIVRRWRLWERTCSPSGQPEAQPSIQLLSIVLLNLKTQSDLGLKNALAPFTPSTCGGWAKAVIDPTPFYPRPNGREITVTLSAAPERLAQRIIYGFPWREPKKSEIKMLGAPINDGKIPVKIFPARMITNEPSNAVKDRVVIIGASHFDSGDIHATPVGEMPGALIIANAIQSLVRNGELRPPSLAVKLTVEALLLVLMSVVFALLSSFWAMLLSGIAVVAILIPIGFWLFRYGVWLDFALPLIAVQLHEMAAAFEENVKRRKREEENEQV